MIICICVMYMLVTVWGICPQVFTGLCVPGLC